MGKETMFKLSYGLFVLTARENGKDNGCIINTVSQVTDTPNRICMTVNKTNYTHDMIVHTGVFTVSIISEGATFDLFKHFGMNSGRDMDKFAGFSSVSRSENGLLYLTENASAYRQNA